MVTRIIVKDFENENLYVVNFINRQTLYRSIRMINKIIWGKYHTDSCSATIMILSNVATPKHCTITRKQRYFKTVRRLNISTEQRLLCFWWLPSVCQASNRIDFAQWSKKLIYKTTFVRRQCLPLWAGINSCSHDALNVFNRRQIWRIWRPISPWHVMSNVVFQPTDCGLWYVYTSTFLNQFC